MVTLPCLDTLVACYIASRYFNNNQRSHNEGLPCPGVCSHSHENAHTYTHSLPDHDSSSSGGERRVFSYSTTSHRHDASFVHGIETLCFIPRASFSANAFQSSVRNRFQERSPVTKSAQTSVSTPRPRLSSYSRPRNLLLGCVNSVNSVAAPGPKI